MNITDILGLGIFKGGAASSQTKFTNISINNNLISLPGSVIALPNISRITSYKIKKAISLKLFMAIASLTSLIITLTEFRAWMTAISLILITITIYTFYYKKFGIQIETNGSTRNTLITRDQNEANSLYAHVLYCMNHPNKVQAFTIDKSMKITIGDQILGDQFKDIENSEIINRSTID